MTGFYSSGPISIDIPRSTLARLRSVPTLASRYEGIVAIDSPEDLIHAPIMVKDDLTAAVEYLRPKAHRGATWTFQSGGSTGVPKLGYAPTGLYMDEVYQQWKPLGPNDVFANCWGAGKMWGAHYLVNAYADLTGCTGISLGAMDRSEYDTWLEFALNRQVTSIGGTPSVLRPLFGYARDNGVKLPDLRSVLFLGEAWNPGLEADVPAVAPHAQRWGLYGSTETWVAGTNTPNCAADTWHLIPSQLVHIGEDQLIDFTSLKPHGLNPLLRYQTGDAGEWVSCTCGEPGRALRILGRRDENTMFRGILFNTDQFVDEVLGEPGVMQAQTVITTHEARGETCEVLVVPTSDAPADLTDRIHKRILSSAYGHTTAFHRDPTCLTVSTVEALIANPRTGKTSNLVRRQAA